MKKFNYWSQILENADKAIDYYTDILESKGDDVLRKMAQVKEAVSYLKEWEIKKDTPKKLTTGSQIRNIRKRRHLSQGELGSRVGLSQVLISFIENDKVLVSRKMRFVFEKALNSSINWSLED